MRATLVLMLLIAFTPSLVSATVQIPDEIVIDGTTRALLTEPEPFVQYLNDFGQHAKLQPYLNGAICSASWRGFRAYWKIADAKLLLVKLLANPCDRQPSLTPRFSDPVRLAESGGFGRAEIRRLEALVRDNAARLRQAWDEYFTE
jgi:hypothetical protein